jgi:glycosyltransferase involved in cell wall biosynthesis
LRYTARQTKVGCADFDGGLIVQGADMVPGPFAGPVERGTKMDIPATAIFFHPDQVEGAGRDLVGRRSAGEGFLKGYLAHGCGDVIRAVCDSADGAKALEEKLQGLGETRPLRVTVLRAGGNFADAGCVFFPTPSYARAAWARQRLGAEKVSLVGITHTVSTRRIIEGFHELMSEPVEDWDAIICTSRAVQSVVSRHMEVGAAYFIQRFGATRVPRPRLPVIPLGVDAAGFAPLPGARERMRERFGAGEGAVVVLTVGRLSVVEKANPYPLFLALEDIAQETGREVHLWITGWASRPEEEALHREGAAALCPSVKVTLVDGRDADVRRNIWAGADIFTLPADSIQETFGLVPVEAMAAGLPVVMPDWDGFRDTVVHGQTGFLVPTRMAPPGTGQTIARRFAEQTDGYMQYLTLVQGQVQIDVPAYRAALLRLMDGDLRATMGAAAAAHVRARFDWAAVIPQYLSLARDLAEARKGRVPTTPPLHPGAVNPMEIDPFALYSDYPTVALRPDTRVTPGQAADAAAVEAYDHFSGRMLYKRRLMAAEDALAIYAEVVRAGETTPEAIARALGRKLDFVLTAVAYLAKADFLRLPEIAPRG